MPSINPIERDPNPPASQLLGRQLADGWRIVAALDHEDTTGGAFSWGYHVENDDGRLGFLKAMDFSSASVAESPVLELESLSRAFNFELRMLERCQKHDRIVTAVGRGEVRVGKGIDGLVPYLIFERADGDIRLQRDALIEFDLVWSLRALHQVAVGIKQLHSAGIAHQDIKPSNLLVFKRSDTKVADLGAASDQRSESANDIGAMVGDAAYAPPELHYGQYHQSWDNRRAGDFYLLGSIIPFLFAGFSMTQLIWNQLTPELSHRNWRGTYESALPHLIAAFDAAVSMAGSAIPSRFRSELMRILRELCHPDPSKRGRAMWLGSTEQYSLESYVTSFDVIATKAEISFGKLR